MRAHKHSYEAMSSQEHMYGTNEQPQALMSMGLGLYEGAHTKNLDFLD